MEINEIIQTLQKTYSEPLGDHQIRRIVFWMDKDMEFADEISEIEVPDVRVHTLTQNNSFQTKFLLEEEDSESHFLIYTKEDLTSEDNWLIDTYLYSQSFYADKVSIIMREIGIDASLRALVKKYKKFFNRSKRINKLKELDILQYDGETFEIALMSVLCNVQTPTFEQVMRSVLMETMDDVENKFIIEIEKFFDVDTFWKYANKYYGFEHTHPSLKKLMTHLSVTALTQTVNEEYLVNV